MGHKSDNSFYPSFFERLFDDGKKILPDAVVSFKKISVQELKQSIAKDIENLLNTRIGPLHKDLSLYPNVQKSSFNFGIQDFIGLSTSDNKTENIILARIKKAIEIHDSRLKNVVVSVDKVNPNQSSLSFAISAVLSINPLHELVNFDAIFFTATQQYKIKNCNK